MSSADDTGKPSGLVVLLDRARMLVPGMPKPWHNLLVAVVLVLIGWGLRAYVDVTLLATGIFGLAAAFLANSADLMVRKDSSRIDIVVVAEQIVALGILSLICGLALALNVFLSETPGGNFQWPTIRKVAFLFIEGLLAAAIAPAIGMILRQMHAHRTSSESERVLGLAGAAKLEHELADATNEARRLTGAVRAAADSFEAAFGALGASMHKAREGLDTDVEALRDSLRKAGFTLTANTTQAVGEIEGAARSLATTVRTIDTQIEAASRSLAATAQTVDTQIEAAAQSLAATVRTVDTQIGEAGQRMAEQLARVGERLEVPTERLDAVTAGFERSRTACEEVIERLKGIAGSADTATTTVGGQFTQLGGRIGEATARLEAFNQLVTDTRRFVRPDGDQ